MVVDVVAVAHCALSVATYGPSVSILFGFEFAILFVTALSGLSMYHVHVIDGVMGFLHHCAEGEHHYNAVGALAVPTPSETQREEGNEQENQTESEQTTSTENAASSNNAPTAETNAPRPKTLAKTLVERLAIPWKNRRATLSFAIELQAQGVKFIFYVVFFAIVFTYYGMPINIFREVYVAFQQLRRRLIAFNNYRRLTHNMEKRFESIQDEEELDRLGHTCIICRDQMDLSGGCKKLPICGHACKFYEVLLWSIVPESTYEHHLFFQSTRIV
jgi:E3 ubiquitin-protein ligase synoviolin